MNKYHDALQKLVEKDENINNFDEQLEKNVQAASAILNLNIHLDKYLDIEHSCNGNVKCKFIYMSFYILHSIKTNESILNINYIHDVKKLFQFIISLGIVQHLIPGVGISLDKRITNFNKVPKEIISVEEKYYRLSSTVKGLLSCLNIISLRNFIFTNHLNDLLASLLQLCYAPVKKPCDVDASKNEFNMTINFYTEVMTDREYFREKLEKIVFQSYSPQVIQELMFFYGSPSSPNWLKCNVYKLLIQILQSSNGVESFIKTVLDSESLDTGCHWKQYAIIVKVLMTKPKNVNNYYENICSQILKLLYKNYYKSNNSNQLLQIISLCIKYLYEIDKNNCEKYFLNPINNTFLQYSNKYNNMTEFNVKTNEITQNVLLFYNCFVVSSITFQSLPYTVLTPIIAILFHFFIFLQTSKYGKVVENLSGIIIKYFCDCNINERNCIFNSLLFGDETNEILQVKSNIEIILNSDDDIKVKSSNINIRINPLMRGEALLNLVKTEEAKSIIPFLCIYLLNASIKTDVSVKTNTDLLNIEDESQMFMNECTERKLTCYNLLSNLIEDSNVQTHLKEHPDSIINFLKNALKICIENNEYKSVHDSEQFQNVFLLIMILKVTIGNLCNLNDDIRNYLTIIYNESSNNELKMLISSISDLKNENTLNANNKKLSKYKKALEDICDSLLPVRGHALMTLAKLIAKKDPEACANKQYILNISQQHIKNEDSYIYLSAIKVLAALGDSFPDTILNILTEEYSVGSKELFEKDSETRIKLGEVLVQIIKSLGEVTPKYKSVLLNTFLNGVKDEDHLIRASSLSNLGEICRVLGYKLGSLTPEILSCIHAVIATDKAVEARRAAVSVIRYLFIGLEKEIIVFLKDEILPIYRTLKVVYLNDPDDITRLQAQLALEELNVNMYHFIFPRVSLEKKIVI